MQYGYDYFRVNEQLGKHGAVAEAVIVTPPVSGSSTFSWQGPLAPPLRRG